MNVRVTDTKLPSCPGCAATMTLVRRWPALGAIPPIDSYGCERCGIVCSATDLGDVTVADQITAQYLELCRDRQEKRKAGVPQCVQ